LQLRAQDYQLAETWLYDEVNESKLRLCRIGRVSVAELTYRESLQTLQVTLSEKFEK
jgi:hypothetical protein